MYFLSALRALAESEFGSPVIGRGIPIPLADPVRCVFLSLWVSLDPLPSCCTKLSRMYFLSALRALAESEFGSPVMGRGIPIPLADAVRCVFLSLWVSLDPLPSCCTKLSRMYFLSALRALAESEFGFPIGDYPEGRGRIPLHPHDSVTPDLSSFPTRLVKGKKGKKQKSREYPTQAEAYIFVRAGRAVAATTGNGAVVGIVDPATAA